MANCLFPHSECFLKNFQACELTYCSKFLSCFVQKQHIFSNKYLLSLDFLHIQIALQQGIDDNYCGNFICSSSFKRWIQANQTQYDLDTSLAGVQLSWCMLCRNHNAAIPTLHHAKSKWRLISIWVSYILRKTEPTNPKTKNRLNHCSESCDTFHAKTIVPKTSKE